MKKENNIKYIINLCFFLYFLILIVERTISIILSFTNGINVFKNGFSIYAYFTVFLSFIGFIIYMIIFNRENVKLLFKFNEVNNINFKNMCIASGIILFSGMVHTEYTVPWLQFISYGILIIGIILKVVLNNKNCSNKSLLWISLVFLISYSMAIPVSYECFLEYHITYHIIQGIATYSLVILFTLMLVKLFDGEYNLFLYEFITPMVILDGTIIILMWKQEINYFVLIFASLSLLLFIGGEILLLLSKKKNKESF